MKNILILHNGKLIRNQILLENYLKIPGINITLLNLKREPWNHGWGGVEKLQLFEDELLIQESSLRDFRK